MKRAPLIPWVLAFLALTALLGGAAAWSSYRIALDRLAEQGRADISLAADRLTAQLLRYRELAVVLTDHPALQALLSGDGDPAAGDRLVQSMADKTGALSVVLVGRDGQVLASSTPTPQRLDPGALPLSRALRGSIGTSQAIIPRWDDRQTRAFSFAAPVYRPAGPPAGAVVATADVRWIEDNWPANTPAAYFVDANGVVFVSNRSDLRLARLGEGGSFPPYSARNVGGHAVWTLDGGPYLPRRALHVERAMPTLGLTANALLDTAPAVRSALAAFAATAALVLVFGAMLLVALVRRRALAVRLALEARANAQLEARVAERTRELASANDELRHEIAERREAEAALKRAQDELVQAGKLSALGQMSAGISHELNQPLMAIRSFAENGALFVERGKPERAGENLGKIAELARRMGRIIQNLRAFARQESGPVTEVDLGAVVEASLEVTAEKLAKGGVAVDWARPLRPVRVLGGEVRLQQVVVNLISNAVDAMVAEKTAAPRIEIGTADLGNRVSLTVRDSGPGLAEPARVFDPFYTTKEVGASEGMGLGLSISYGLIQSFGGTIQGTNHPGGGALFTVELRSVREAAA
ncbi:MAG: sensor histidine kinase [Maritimibacter sp.]|nr:sensor histidine kinase [Maritimibacter sp.]